jgi:GNAT superfamily N-acetyltransferase
MLRNAILDDLSFMHKLIWDGSKKGHFHQEFYSNPAANAGLVTNLESILNRGKRLDEDLTASAYIFEENGIPISFMIISAIENRNKGSEIWMMATEPAHQKKGVATFFLDNILQHFKDNNKAVEARCKAASDVMCQLLLKKGFEHLETDEIGTRFLIFR